MFILTYIKAWGILMTPISYVWLFVWMAITGYFSKLSEKGSDTFALVFFISTILLVIGVSVWCWYIAGDVLNFFSGLKGE